MIELVDYIRLLSRDGRLVTAEQVITVAGLKNEIEDSVAAHEQLIQDSKYQDIAIIAGKDDHFFYSKRFIISSYAVQWVGVNDGDLIETMADYIRKYSVLGELVSANNFTHPPYKLDSKALSGLNDKFNKTPGCEDIHFQATGEKGFYFSIKSITKTYAKVLSNYDPFEWSV